MVTNERRGRALECSECARGLRAGSQSKASIGRPPLVLPLFCCGFGLQSIQLEEGKHNLLSSLLYEVAVSSS